MAIPSFPPSNVPAFSFGFSRPDDQPVPVPAFTNNVSSSLFNRAPVDAPLGFTFGAGQTQKNITDDINMGGSWQVASDHDICITSSLYMKLKCKVGRKE